MLIDEDGREITFVEYRAECERVAAGFQELGVTAGTVVSWQLPTWIESVVLVGALSRLGAVQNPILPIYREREVGFVAKQTGAKFLLVPGRVARVRLRGDGARRSRRTPRASRCSS